MRLQITVAMILICFEVPLDGQDEVSRVSLGREADTVHGLAKRRRYDQAIRWCDDRLAVLPARSEGHAWWACTRAKVQAQQAKQDGAFSKSEAERLCRPLSDLLVQYSDHPKLVFVQATIESVRLQSIATEVVQLAIETSDDERIDGILRLLIALDGRVEDLIRAAQSTMADDDQQHDQELVVAELSLLRLQAAMLRTELFAEGSRDFVASSAKSISLIEKVRSALPSASASRLEADLLHCQALLRGRSLDRATRALQATRRSLRDGSAGVDAESRWLAMLVELHLLQEDLDSARRRLDSHFGSVPEDATLDLPMDLARLKFLIESARSASEARRSELTTKASRWIDSIGQRHDAYARRRAEAILLSRWESAPIESAVGSAGTPRGPSDVNAALLVLRGQQSLRDGQLKEGARQLTLAALAEVSPSKAVDIALQAAAAWRKAGTPSGATDVLTKIAAKHSGESRCASLHLQAAVIATSEVRPPWDVGQLIDHLKWGVTTWPGDRTAVRASKAWAVKTLVASNQLPKATDVLSWTKPENWISADVDDAVNTWFRWLTTGDAETAYPRFETWLSSVLASGNVSNEALLSLSRAGVMGLDIGDLRQSESRITEFLARSSDREPAGVLEELMDFRRGRSTAMSRSFPKSWHNVIEWRLMRDGRQQAARRDPGIAMIETQLSADATSDSPDIFEVERLIWQSKLDDARERLRMIQAESGPPGALKQLAVRLARSQRDTDQEFSLRLWDELSAGVKQATPAWHEAKLAAAKVLIELGRSDEAERRLRYVLLTQPPAIDAIRERYQSLLKASDASTGNPSR